MSGSFPASGLRWLSVVLALGLASCADSHEKVVDDSLDQVEKVFELILNIEDRKSADKATEKIKKMEPAFEKLAARAEKLDEPDEETKKRLNERLKKFQEDLQKKLASHESSGNLKEEAQLAVYRMEAMMEFAKLMERLPDYGK